jgi:hypothetical protein
MGLLFIFQPQFTFRQLYILHTPTLYPYTASCQFFGNILFFLIVFFLKKIILFFSFFNKKKNTVTIV